MSLVKICGFRVPPHGANTFFLRLKSSHLRYNTIASKFCITLEDYPASIPLRDRSPIVTWTTSAPALFFARALAGNLPKLHFGVADFENL